MVYVFIRRLLSVGTLASRVQKSLASDVEPRCNRGLSELNSPMTTATNSVYRIDPAELPDEAVIFGSTPAMRAIRSRINSVLSSDAPILIQGESGTGKEVLARYLHSRSCRRDAPYVRLNCGAVPANLLEIELFGCEEGFIAGSPGSRQGLIEIAEDGTLFLEEIDSMPWEMQGRLLEFLMEGCYRRMGSDEKRRGRVRVICATNVDLQDLVSLGGFREDLFYCIDGVSLRLSALRDRKSDIPQLCEHLFEKLSQQFRRGAPQLKPDTLRLLRQWDWPGNLRELENWVARAILLRNEFAEGIEFGPRKDTARTFIGSAPRLAIVKRPRRTVPEVAGTANVKILRAHQGTRYEKVEKFRVNYGMLLKRLRKSGVPKRHRTHRGLPLDTLVYGDSEATDSANPGH